MGTRRKMCLEVVCLLRMSEGHGRRLGTGGDAGLWPQGGEKVWLIGGRESSGNRWLFVSIS